MSHTVEEESSQRAQLPPWAFPALASLASHLVAGFTDPCLCHSAYKSLFAALSV